MPEYNITLGLVMLVIFGILAVVIYLPLNYLFKKLSASLQKIARTTLIIIGITGFSFFMFQVGFAILIQGQVNRQLGFNYATPCSEDGEAFIITRVDSNMAMFRAGLKVNDTVRLTRVDDLYTMLLGNQGGEVSIPIRRGGETLEVKVWVPVMKIRYRGICMVY
ncbi:MAG: hypothetical protein JXA03_14440 [Bacteroidales bacterium]|nr:hypothetical protein [Bacteroidales bacterium]